MILQGCLCVPRVGFCQALWVPIQLDCEGAEESGAVDPRWLQDWTEELSAGIPGFQMLGEPVHVESQESRPTQQLTPPDAEHDLDQLLRDEEEERVWKAQREQEEAEDRQRLENYEAMAAQEADHLRMEAGAFQEWENRQADAMRREPPCKKRCLVSMEVASSSTDAPRITHRLEFEVPVNGSALSITLQARMTESAESTPTVPAPAATGDRGQCSMAVELDTAPDLLPYLDFPEYEAVYRAWRAGERTLSELQAQYGKEVAELLQAQRALAEEVDAAPKGEKLEATGQDMDKGLLMPGRSPACAAGQPKLRFGFFENMYGKWKRGEGNDRNVLEEFGTVWLELFRVWHRWGLDAIHPYLLQELDMANVEEDEEARQSIPPTSPVSIPIRIPFSVIRDVYRLWRSGELGDGQMVERYGEVWLVLFQLLAVQGLSGAVHESLDNLVLWNVTTLGELNVGDPVDQAGHVGTTSSMASTVVLPGGDLAATAPEEGSSAKAEEGHDASEAK